MFKISFDKTVAEIRQQEILTSDAINAFVVKCEFDKSWDGLEKFATFKAGEIEKTKKLSADDSCVIPWEVLAAPELKCCMSVIGMQGNDIVLPSVWVSLGLIHKGGSLSEESREPTPTVFQDILTAVTSAKEIAQELRDDAAEGKFDGADGYTPQKNVDYFDGDDGITPHIGTNGNWHIGESDTGVRAEGNIMYATFDIDVASGQLIMTTPEGYKGARFRIKNNGHMEVEI